LITHEFGHSLGLPDLYVENKSPTIDRLSLMARGDRNGVPEGTSPASLDGFSMYMLGWLNPTPVTLNSTEDIVEMKPLAYSSASLLKVSLSDSEYYLIEVREKLELDEYAVTSTSVVVYTIDEMKESAKGIATIPTGGVVAQGSIYSDSARNIFVKFISFNASTHLATVGLSAQLFFVEMDIPHSVPCFFTAAGTIEVLDINNKPAQGIHLNVIIGENQNLLLVNDDKGKADFQFVFGFNELGNRGVKITSRHMLGGEIESELSVVFPWAYFIIALLWVAFVITLLYAKRLRARVNAQPS